jgi:hypothetical protein
MDQPAYGVNECAQSPTNDQDDSDDIKKRVHNVFFYVLQHYKQLNPNLFSILFFWRQVVQYILFIFLVVKYLVYLLNICRLFHFVEPGVRFGFHAQVLLDLVQHMQYFGYLVFRPQIRPTF